MNQIPEKLDIDMRTPAQKAEEDNKEFLQDLEELQQRHKKRLIPSMNYQQNGTFPVIGIMNLQDNKPTQ